MTGSYLERSGNKLPNDWRSYLRMRDSACHRVLDQQSDPRSSQRVLDQNTNLSCDPTSCLTARNNYLSEYFDGKGSSSLNLYSRTNEFKTEPWFTPTKSVFKAWMSSTSSLTSQKLMSITSKPIVRYSPIRHRYATRFLPLRYHLDIWGELSRPLPTLKCLPAMKQIDPQEDFQCIWSKPCEGPSCADTPTWLQKKQGSDSAQHKHKQEQHERQVKLNQNRSADRAHSPRKQLIDTFWWDTAKSSRKPDTTPTIPAQRLSCLPGDSVQRVLRANRSRSHQPSSARSGAMGGSVTRDMSNRHGSAHSATTGKTLHKDENASKCKQTDARTVEIKRQLMAAREKVQQKEMGFNLRLEQPVKQHVARELEKRNRVPYEPLCQRGPIPQSELVRYSPIGRNIKGHNNASMFTNTTKSFETDQSEKLRNRIRKDKEIVKTQDKRAQSPAVPKAKRRCKLKSNVSTSSPKVSLKQRKRRRNGTASRQHGFGDVKDVTLKETEGSRPGRPHSAGNVSSTVVAGKDKNMNLVQTQRSPRKHRIRSALEKPVEPSKPDDECDTLVSGDSIPPEQTHSFEHCKSQQIQKKKLKNTDRLPKRAKTHKDETRSTGKPARDKESQVASSLQKLADARRKLRELLEAGDSSVPHASMESVVQAIETLQQGSLSVGPASDIIQHDSLSMSVGDLGQGGLCPPQHQLDTFFYNDSQSKSRDAVNEKRDSKNQDSFKEEGKNQDSFKEEGKNQDSFKEEGKNHDPLKEKGKNHDPLKEKGPSLKGNSVAPVQQSSRPPGQVEKFPKTKAYAAFIQKPSASWSRPDRAGGAGGGKNPKRSSPRVSAPVAEKCEDTSEEKAEAPTTLSSVTKSPNSKGSVVLSADVKRSTKLEPVELACGETAEVKKVVRKQAEMRPSGAEAGKSRDSEPRSKKKRVKRKKKSCVLLDDETQDGPGTRGNRSTWLLPKTYHQLGLAPLVRSPSSENTFQFAVDLCSMEVAVKPKKRRRKRRSMRSLVFF